MGDLIKRLRGLAERDTAMSEFGPDEHIAGIAAEELQAKDDRIEELEDNAIISDANIEAMATRNAELEAALKDIAIQKLCDEMTDEETVDQGCIEYAYDQIILVARKALNTEKDDG